MTEIISDDDLFSLRVSCVGAAESTLKTERYYANTKIMIWNGRMMDTII